MKLKADFRIYLAAILIIATITTTALGWWKPPVRVERVEARVEEVSNEAEESTEVVEDEVNKLAVTINQYIAVQTVRQEAQDTREQMMLQLILQKTSVTAPVVTIPKPAMPKPEEPPQ